jgi:hypothetical protein
MAQAEREAAPGPAPESLHPNSLTPESPATAAPGQSPGEKSEELVANLEARFDSMRDWASETKSQIRGLVSGLQVLNERTAALEGLRDTVDLIGQQVGELGSIAAAAIDPGDATDRAIGYQASIEQQAQLFAALAEWQITAKPLEKGQIANIQTKAGGSVSYRYADIASVSEIARSAGNFGLAHFHREIAIQGQPFIRTYLVHKGGGWICCDVPLLMKENTLISSLQQWASACTMARRYGLFMVLGIAAGDEDDDGINAGRRNQPPPAGANQTTGTRTAATRTSAPR